MMQLPAILQITNSKCSYTPQPLPELQENSRLMQSSISCGLEKLTTSRFLLNHWKLSKAGPKASPASSAPLDEAMYSPDAIPRPFSIVNIANTRGFAGQPRKIYCYKKDHQLLIIKLARYLAFMVYSSSTGLIIFIFFIR